jgi:hypothetical protein
LRVRVRFVRSAQAHDYPPSCARQDHKIVPRSAGVSLRGTPLLAEASLRGARLSSTSLSVIWMLADASLHCASLGETFGLADASLRGVSLSDTLLLADSLLERPQHLLLCHLGLY